MASLQHRENLEARLKYHQSAREAAKAAGFGEEDEEVALAGRKIAERQRRGGEPREGLSPRHAGPGGLQLARRRHEDRCLSFQRSRQWQQAVGHEGPLWLASAVQQITRQRVLSAAALVCGTLP